ncbi:MAG: GNAT family N-acetyltransferase [Jatrophihabitantaceae bacterium]
MSRASVRVRPAERADVADLVALVSSIDTRSGIFSGRAIIDPGVAHLSERLDEILDENARTLLVAIDDASGLPVGMLVAKMDEIGAIDLTAALHITHLIVAPSHRRRGVGRTLMAAAVHLADERGVDRVLATASSGSREANRYLARLGFAPLVVHRVASTTALRRSLGISDASNRMAVLRRARVVRARRAQPTRTSGAVGRGA